MSTPLRLEECSTEQMIHMINYTFNTNDNLTKYQDKKARFISYFKENNISGAKFVKMNRKEFGNSIISYYDDTKLMGISIKLFRLLHECNLTQLKYIIGNTDSFVDWDRIGQILWECDFENDQKVLNEVLDILELYSRNKNIDLQTFTNIVYGNDNDKRYSFGKCLKKMKWNKKKRSRFYEILLQNYILPVTDDLNTIVKRTLSPGSQKLSTHVDVNDESTTESNNERISCKKEKIQNLIAEMKHTSAVIHEYFDLCFPDDLANTNKQINQFLYPDIAVTEDGSIFLPNFLSPDELSEELNEWNRGAWCPLQIANNRCIAIDNNIFIMNGGGCIEGECFIYNIDTNKFKLLCKYPDRTIEGAMVIDITDSKNKKLIQKFELIVSNWFRKLFVSDHSLLNDILNMITSFSSINKNYILSFGGIGVRGPINKFQQLIFDKEDKKCQWETVCKCDIEIGEGANCVIGGKNSNLLIISGGVNHPKDIIIFDISFQPYKLLKYFKNILPQKCKFHGFVNCINEKGTKLLNKFVLWGITSHISELDEEDDAFEEKKYFFEIEYNENKQEFNISGGQINSNQRLFETYTLYKNNIITFGGKRNSEVRATDIISYYSFKTKTWTESVIKLPSERRCATAIYSSYKNNVHIFGGEDDDGDETRGHFYINSDKLLT
eukprot:476345_1